MQEWKTSPVPSAGQYTASTGTYNSVARHGRIVGSRTGVAAVLVLCGSRLLAAESSRSCHSHWGVGAKEAGSRCRSLGVVPEGGRIRRVGAKAAGRGEECTRRIGRAEAPVAVGSSRGADREGRYSLPIDLGEGTGSSLPAAAARDRRGRILDLGTQTFF